MRLRHSVLDETKTRRGGQIRLGPSSLRLCVGGFAPGNGQHPHVTASCKTNHHTGCTLSAHITSQIYTCRASPPFLCLYRFLDFSPRFLVWREASQQEAMLTDSGVGNQRRSASSPAPAPWFSTLTRSPSIFWALSEIVHLRVAWSLTRSPLPARRIASQVRFGIRAVAKCQLVCHS